MFLVLGKPVEGGRILGHEFSGEVVELGAEVEGVRVGDRVVAAGVGANAEYYLAPAPTVSRLLRVPDAVSFEEAATTEPLATSLHAVNLARPTDDETILIMGSGIIGLGVLQVVKAFSAAQTIVVDLSDKRLAVAKELGADATINASREETGERIAEIAAGRSDRAGAPPAQVDAVFDCAGVTRDLTGTSALEQALNLVKPNGKVVIVAAFEKPLAIDFNLVMGKGIHLIGSFAWSPEELAQALDLLSSGRIDRRPLITHEFPLERASEAYETQLKAEEAVKVLLKP
jgi:2-desacetyl-2-hydroxyethyl bacteriochlorophyllide A dehydrogenase